MAKFVARRIDGTKYESTGNYMGSGIVRYCALCKEHRAVGSGKIRMVRGVKSWTCKRHEEVLKEKQDEV